MVLNMKNKIGTLLKKTFLYVKKHFTNFLLGVIIIILLIGLYNLSPSFKMWILGTKYKITGQRHETQIIGKVKYICREFDFTSYSAKYKADNPRMIPYEQMIKYRADNEEQFYKNIEKYTNVIRSRDWILFIFKTYEKISFYPKMDKIKCKCAENDTLTNTCKWTKLDKPIPTGYLFEKDR